MPSIAIHLAVATKLVDKGIIKENTEKNISDFYAGNLYPDVYIDKDEIHHYHYLNNKTYIVPNIEIVEKNLDVTNYFSIGIFTHLITDILFDMKYLSKLVPEKEILQLYYSEIIYKEYSSISKSLVKKYNLLEKIKYLETLKTKSTIKIESLEKNINFLKIKNNNVPEILNIDLLEQFIEETSIHIINKLQK